MAILGFGKNKLLGADSYSSVALGSGSASASHASLGSLYQEVVLDHSKRPRFKHRPSSGCQFCQDGKNPLCGDEITIFCKLADEELKQSAPKISVFFEGKGCSISQASASILCESIQACTIAEARKKIAYAEAIYTGKANILEENLEEDVEALFGVSKFPVRVKCAALPWKTLELLLDEKFDSSGKLLTSSEPCVSLSSCGREQKKLRIVSTED